MKKIKIVVGDNNTYQVVFPNDIKRSVRVITAGVITWAFIAAIWEEAGYELEYCTADVLTPTF